MTKDDLKKSSSSCDPDNYRGNYTESQLLRGWEHVQDELKKVDGDILTINLFDKNDAVAKEKLEKLVARRDALRSHSTKIVQALEPGMSDYDNRKEFGSEKRFTISLEDKETGKPYTYVQVADNEDDARKLATAIHNRIKSHGVTQVDSGDKDLKDDAAKESAKREREARRAKLASDAKELAIAGGIDVPHRTGTRKIDGVSHDTWEVYSKDGQPFPVTVPRYYPEGHDRAGKLKTEHTRRHEAMQLAQNAISQISKLLSKYSRDSVRKRPSSPDSEESTFSENIKNYAAGLSDSKDWDHSRHTDMSVDDETGTDDPAGGDVSKDFPFQSAYKWSPREYRTAVRTFYNAIGDPNAKGSDHTTTRASKTIYDDYKRRLSALRKKVSAKEFSEKSKPLIEERDSLISSMEDRLDARRLNKEHDDLVRAKDSYFWQKFFSGKKSEPEHPSVLLNRLKEMRRASSEEIGKQTEALQTAASFSPELRDKLQSLPSMFSEKGGSREAASQAVKDLLSTRSSSVDRHPHRTSSADRHFDALEEVFFGKNPDGSFTQSSTWTSSKFQKLETDINSKKEHIKDLEDRISKTSKSSEKKSLSGILEQQVSELSNLEEKQKKFSHPINRQLSFNIPDSSQLLEGDSPKAAIDREGLTTGSRGDDGAQRSRLKKWMLQAYGDALRNHETKNYLSLPEDKISFLTEEAKEKKQKAAPKRILSHSPTVMSSLKKDVLKDWDKKRNSLRKQWDKKIANSDPSDREEQEKSYENELRDLRKKFITDTFVGGADKKGRHPIGELNSSVRRRALGEREGHLKGLSGEDLDTFIAQYASDASSEPLSRDRGETDTGSKNRRVLTNWARDLKSTLADMRNSAFSAEGISTTDPNLPSDHSSFSNRYKSREKEFIEDIINQLESPFQSKKYEGHPIKDLYEASKSPKGVNEDLKKLYRDFYEDVGNTRHKGRKIKDMSPSEVLDALKDMYGDVETKTKGSVEESVGPTVSLPKLVGDSVDSSEQVVNFLTQAHASGKKLNLSNIVDTPFSALSEDGKKHIKEMLRKSFDWVDYMFTADVLPGVFLNLNLFKNFNASEKDKVRAFENSFGRDTSGVNPSTMNSEIEGREEDEDSEDRKSKLDKSLGLYVRC